MRNLPKVIFTILFGVAIIFGSYFFLIDFQKNFHPKPVKPSKEAITSASLAVQVNETSVNESKEVKEVESPKYTTVTTPSPTYATNESKLTVKEEKINKGESETIDVQKLSPTDRIVWELLNELS